MTKEYHKKLVNDTPQYMLKIIKKQDEKSYPKPDGHTRFYSYLTTMRKQIAKVTVAVRHKYTKWYCKH